MQGVEVTYLAMQQCGTVVNVCPRRGRLSFCQVYVQLRGMVDFDVEIKKLQKQLDTKIEPQITMLVKKMEAPGYEDKVPEAVRETNSKKKAEFEAQKDSVLKAMQQFEGLKI
ncbi:unnamed protein product [Ectocarpus sp. CCAP 1310/34]|nr:unnamed protein product [Ectocarpus sp. CCAP 1310/34]